MTDISSIILWSIAKFISIKYIFLTVLYGWDRFKIYLVLLYHLSNIFEVPNYKIVLATNAWIFIEYISKKEYISFKNKE